MDYFTFTYYTSVQGIFEKIFRHPFQFYYHVLMAYILATNVCHWYMVVKLIKVIVLGCSTFTYSTNIQEIFEKNV